MGEPQPSKRCTKCSEQKLLTEFYRQRVRGTADGRRGVCKTCFNQSRSRSRVYRQAARREEAERQDRYYQTIEQRDAQAAERAHGAHARTEGRAAWQEWIEHRAPAAWLRRYWGERARLARERRSRAARRLHFRRIATVATGKGSSREDRWRACQRQSDGTLTEAVVMDLYAHAAECTYCGVALNAKNLTLDHVVPLEVGGVHGVSNLVPACRACNASKSRRPVDEWLVERSNARHGRESGLQSRAAS